MYVGSLDSKMVAREETRSENILYQIAWVCGGVQAL